MYELFWAKVEKTDGCWIWIGCRQKEGYGQLTMNQVQFYAHRLSWEIANGPIPQGMGVLHKCDNPPCVNPAHLFLGTQKENILDMIKKGRRLYSGEHSLRAKLTLAQVTQIRSSSLKYRELAAIYEVHISTIGLIKTGRNWK